MRINAAKRVSSDGNRDRTGSGLKAILAGSGLDRTAIFLKLADQDWIRLRNFFVLM